MNHGLTLIVSFFSFVQTTFRDFGSWVWAHRLRVYKVFTKTDLGSLMKRRLCLGPAGVINCTPLPALSFWVSLFPGTRGYNKSCLTLCDPMEYSMPGLPVRHQHPKFTQTHVNWVGDAIQPSHPLLSPSPPTFNLSQSYILWEFFFSFPAGDQPRLIQGIRRRDG